jgi:hypothetical protein
MENQHMYGVIQAPQTDAVGSPLQQEVTEVIDGFGQYAKHVILRFKADDGEREHLGVTSTSPFVHVVGNASPVTIEYRAAYLNSKGEQGPWGEMDAAYVGAAA